MSHQAHRQDAQHRTALGDNAHVLGDRYDQRHAGLTQWLSNILKWLGDFADRVLSASMEATGRLAGRYSPACALAP